MTKPPRYPCGHSLIAPLLGEVARQQGVTHKALETALAARLGIARATVRAWGTGYARPQSDGQARALLALAREARWTPSQKAGLLDCIEARPSLREELLSEAVARSKPLSHMVPVVTAHRVLTLAQKWDLTADEVGRNVFAHPTLSEAVKEAVEGIVGHMINF